jgi:hypothetical protein
VHGIAGEVYSLISDRNVQLNSRFVFLTNITCPKLDRPAQVHCSSHPGNYFDSFVLSTSNGDRLRINSAGVDRGFSSVLLNNRVVEVGESYGAASPAHQSHGDPVSGINRNADHPAREDIYVHRTSSRSLTVHAGLYEMLIVILDLLAVRDAYCNSGSTVSRLLVWKLVANRTVRAGEWYKPEHPRTADEEERAATAADRVPIYFFDDQTDLLLMVGPLLFMDLQWWTTSG